MNIGDSDCVVTQELSPFKIFLIKLDNGHETTYAFSGNKHFSLNNVRLAKIMNNLLEHLKILMH